jgi:hypothetical protein
VTRTGVSELECGLHAEDCEWARTVRHANLYWPDLMLASPCGHGQTGVCNVCWPCTCLVELVEIEKLDFMVRRLRLWDALKQRI